MNKIKGTTLKLEGIIFVRFSNYLGMGTAQGYSPYLVDGKTDFLPGLTTDVRARFGFFSSSLYGDARVQVFFGKIGSDDKHSTSIGRSISDGFATRCVADH
ncbi:MAG: hypothetical protein IPM97_03960 [Bdellovibrionaceae bacterium]|nr:hypothetical protein [Pseudobdellovibrionaceae bacterium]